MKLEVNGSWVIIAVAVVLGAFSVWGIGSQAKKDARADISYDTLAAHMRQLRADSAAHARVDLVTQRHIVALEGELSRETARRAADSAHADSVTREALTAVTDTAVPRDSAAQIVRAAFVALRIERDRWRRIASINEGLYIAEKSRHQSSEVLLANTQRELADALGQVKLERARSNPGLLRRIARDAPWYLVVHIAGRLRVP